MARYDEEEGTLPDGSNSGRMVKTELSQSIRTRDHRGRTLHLKTDQLQKGMNKSEVLVGMCILFNKSHEFRR